MYLIDTNVLSELRKPDQRVNPFVLQWSETLPQDDVWVSVITLMELERGMLLVERRDSAQAARLRSWLNGLRKAYAHRTIVIDEAVASVCARLHVPNPQPPNDALIAATALVHDLTVATRNVKDFEPLGVRVFDPWDYEVSAT